MADSVSEWKKAVSGNSATLADWTAGVPNGATDDADLLVGGKAYTVTSTAADTVGFLDLASNATLAIVAASDFTVFSSANPYSNAYNLGTIAVSAGATLAFGQAASPSNDSAEIFNNGAVTVSGAGSTLQIDAPWFELNGSGTLKLANGAIVGATTGTGNTLDNKSNTITGSGTIGNGAGASGGAGLWLQNDTRATIDANGATALVLNTGTNGILNSGLVETTGAGGLVIDSFFSQQGSLVADGAGDLKINGAEVIGSGTVTVDKGATIALADGVLNIGGTISIAAGGVLTNTTGDLQAVTSNNEFAGDTLVAGDIENAGIIQVLNNSTLNLNGSIFNAGVGKLMLDGTTGPTEIDVFGSGAGVWHGSIVLSNSLDNSIVTNGEGEQFSNESTLMGAGTIGDGWLRVFNPTIGVIDADDSDGLTIIGDSSAVSAMSESANFNAGVIETTGAGSLTITGVLTNSGVLAADGSGALTLTGATLSTGGGMLEVAAGGSMVLKSNTIITGQSELTVTAGGKLITTGGDTADTLEATAFNAGTIGIVDNSKLVVDGHFQNTGAIDLEGAGDQTSLAIASGQTLELLGHGTVTLMGVGNSIIGGGPSAQLDNKNNTIIGAGSIGDANTTIANRAGATIEATKGSLTVDSTAYNSGTNTDFISNAGVMEAGAGGSLTIESAMSDFGRLIAATGGTIVAEDQVFGNGLAEIQGTGSIEFGAEVDNDVAFSGKTAGTLILDNSTPSEAGDPFFGSISGFAMAKTTSDTIDLRDLAFSAGTMTVDPSSGFGALDASLVVSNGATTSTALYLLGAYTANEFKFSSDNHGGTDITLVKPA